MNDLADLMQASERGDTAALERLFSTLYGELRDLARARLRGGGGLTLLNTTGLVHESFLRCVNANRVLEADRARFLGYAARVMRSIIIDYVRSRQAERHGGKAVHVTLDTLLGDSLAAPEDSLIRVSEALDEISASDPRLAQVVEMRFFAGMTEPEIAASLGVTERTVRRDWRKAQMMLSLALR